MRQRARGPELPARLARAQQQLERWRDARERRTIPESLWSMAAELAEEYGLHRTSRALRLNYYSLKKRVEADTDDTTTSEEPPVFVDFEPILGGTSGSEGLAEFVGTDGEVMRVQWKGGLPAELAAVAGAFRARST